MVKICGFLFPIQSFIQVDFLVKTIKFLISCKKYPCIAKLKLIRKLDSLYQNKNLSIIENFMLSI